MKKKISIVLILAMILSIFSSFAYAEEHPARAIGREVKNNALVKKVLGLSYKTKLDLATMMYFLRGERNTIVDYFFDAIEEPGSLSARLGNNGVTRENVKTILGKINDEVDNISISELEALLREKNITWNTEIKTDVTVGDKAEEIYDRLLENFAIEEMNSKINAKLRSGKTKVGFVLELVGELVDYGKLTKTITNTKTTYSFSVKKKENLLNKINSEIDTYFEGVAELDSSVISVIGELESRIDKIFQDITKRSDGNAYFNENEKSIIFDAVKSINSGSVYVDDKTTSGGDPTDPGGSGSSSGGGGGDKTETPSETEEPPEEPAEGQVELGKDAVEVEPGENGEAIIKVKEDSMAEAIDELLKIAEEDPDITPQLIIKLDDVETLDMEISIPADLMAKLAENGIGLIIESGALTYEVPADALAAILADAPEGSYIEFISSEVDSAEIEELIGDESANVARVIELQLALRDGNGEPIEGIGKFGSKIKTGIEITAEDGNPDLLAVFYIDEETGELKFVGGKVKDNKINMATDHYSKFAVIEYDKSFSDIEKHWSKDYVKSMVAKHVIDGFEDNTYKPEDKLTRAQFAKLLVEVLELDKIAYKGEFQDVLDVHWAKDYIATAKQQGIIAGYEDGTFMPEQTINRVEMGAMITNALKLNKDSDSKILEKFKDAQDIPAWAAEYVVPVVAEGLLVGSDGVLNPLGYVTRAEAATIIYRVYNR